MSQLDLDAIQARANAATEGPWIIFGSIPQWENEEDLSFGPDDAPEVGVVNEGLADAEFIAHARTDVPALLALAREQAAKLEEVRDLLGWLEAASVRPGVEEFHSVGKVSARVTAERIRAALDAS